MKKRLKKLLGEINKKQVAGHIIRLCVMYSILGPISGPTAALALDFNTTELTEGYSTLVKSCLGGRRLGVPVPSSYLEGSLCAAMLLTCGIAASQGLANIKLDAACIALIRALSEPAT